MGRAAGGLGGPRRWLAALCVGTWLGLAGVAQVGWAQESILEDRTAPEAAEQSRGMLERAFEERLERKTLLPRFKDFLEKQPLFIRDTSTARPRMAGSKGCGSACAGQSSSRTAAPRRRFA
jgi:hypothetical protein